MTSVERGYNRDGNCDSFIMGMPAYLKESEQVLLAHAGNVEKYGNKLNDRHIYCISVNATIYGVPGRVLLYYDSWNHLYLSGDMFNHINRLKAELTALKRYPKSKLGRYKTYFVLTKHEQDSGFDFIVDEEKVEEMIKQQTVKPLSLLLRVQ